MRLMPIAAGVLAVSLTLCGCAQAGTRSDAKQATGDLAIEASNVPTASSAEATDGAPDDGVDEAVRTPPSRAGHDAIPTEAAVVPQGYEDPCDEAGTLVYLPYTASATDFYDEREKYAIVYLPYGYDEDAEQQYDIVYLMHGAGGNADEQLGIPEWRYPMANIVDHMIQDGLMQPAILVAATYYPENVAIETDDWDASLTRDFGTELREDLMPAVESRYRTYAEVASPEGFAASRGHRAFGGFSMGGVTTWYRVCDSLDYFEYFLPISGTLLWGADYESLGPDGPEITVNQVAQAIEQQGFGSDEFFIYMTTGARDFALESVEQTWEALSAYPGLFITAGADQAQNVAYLLADGEEHDLQGYDRAVFGGLQCISTLMNTA